MLASWGPVGGPLEALLARLQGLAGRLEAILDRRGVTLGRLDALLDHLGALFEPCLAVLGCFEAPEAPGEALASS